MKLELRDLNKSFSGKKILKSVSFKVYSGRTMGFLGRNGAGKTTTIRCIMNVFKPDSGEIILDGKPFNRDDYKIGYLPEERGMYAETSLISQITYFGRLKGMSAAAAKKAAEEWIERLELADYAKKKLKTLSKGNQQKIQLTQALVNDPDILILDEPFSGLDPVNAGTLKDIIRSFISKNRLVIFSSHQMSYVEQFCDDVTIIQNGEIMVTGPLSDLRNALNRYKYKISLPDYDQSTVDKIAGDLNSFSQKFEAEALPQKMLELHLPEIGDKAAFFSFIAQNQLNIELFAPVTSDLETVFVYLSQNPEAAENVQVQLDAANSALDAQEAYAGDDVFAEMREEFDDEKAEKILKTVSEANVAEDDLTKEDGEVH